MSIRRLWVLLSVVAVMLVAWMIYRQAATSLGSEYARNTWTYALAPLYGEWHRDPWHIPWHWRAAPLLVMAGWIGLVFHQYTRPRPQLALMAILAVPMIAAINISSSASDGGLWRLHQPFHRTTHEYYGDINVVGDDPIGFIRRYPELMRSKGGTGHRGYVLSLHSSTHPPGPALTLWAVSRMFGPSVKVAAVAAILLGALSGPVALLLARTVLPPRGAIVALGLLALAPASVLYGATSMDMVFAVLPLAGAALLAMAWYQSRSYGQSLLLSMVAGALLAAAMFFTFTTMCIGIIFGCIWLFHSQAPNHWRDLSVLLTAAAIFVTCYLLLYLLFGYDFFQVLIAAMERNDKMMGTGHESWQRYLDVSVGNLLAFVVGAGLACSAAWLLSCRRGRPATSSMNRGSLLAITALAFATIFTTETERVWIMLYAFPAIAAASWITTPPPNRASLQTLPAWPVLVVFSLQAIQIVLLELLLETHW